MSKDYETKASGSLMDEIQALISPPGEERKRREGLDLHPYFRRPGRGHNNDKCDSCGEGGDLLCCDLCPASFHLGCHDPPIPEEAIPSGDWICHKCKATEALKLGAVHRTSYQHEAERDNTACADVMAIRSPLQQLIQAASLLNPKQFELPSEMVVNEILPGETKLNTKGQGNRKRPHELDNGLVPLPAKLCFACAKSCRVAPLLACDYCASCFHMDCLDPPLTTMPTGSVWMCPLHVENFLDSELLTTSRLTERLKLWSRFQGPIDQDAVKLQFLRRVHRKHPPFRYKVKIRNANLVDIPDEVKSHYKNPLPVPPPPVSNSLAVSRDTVPASKDEQELWLNSVIGMQLAASDVLKQHTMAALDAIIKDEPDKPTADHPQADVTAPVKSEVTTNGDCSDSVKKQAAKKLPGMKNPRMDTILKAFLTEGRHDRWKPVAHEADHSAELRELRAQVSAAGTLDLSVLDDRLVQLLAVQRLQQLVGAHVTGRLAPRAELEPQRCVASLAAPRATLTPLGGLGSTEYVRYRTYTVGSGADNALNLDAHGFCNFVSGQHAVVFYDDASRRFELLNYSEHGTAVDGVLYACHFSGRTLTPAESPPPVEAAARALADRRRQQRQAPAGGADAPAGSTMSKRACLERRRCRCACAQAGAPDAPRRGFESSALLQHGCLLQFGCLRFVFAETTGVQTRHDSIVGALIERRRHGSGGRDAK